MSYLFVVSSILSAALHACFPAAITFWLHHQFSVPLKHLTCGILVFAVALILRIPLYAGILLFSTFLGEFYQSSAVTAVVFIASEALSAGILEEVGRYIGLKYLKKEGIGWVSAVAYGLGHGGFETILLGTWAAVTLMAQISIAYVDATKLSPYWVPMLQDAERIFAVGTWWEPFLTVFGRGGMLIVQMSLAVVVLQCFVRRNIYWLSLAIGYHVVVHSTALMSARFLSFEFGQGMLALFAAVSLYLIFRFRDEGNLPNEPEVSSAHFLEGGAGH